MPGELYILTWKDIQKTLSKKGKLHNITYSIYSLYSVCIYIYFHTSLHNLYINIHTNVFIHTKKMSGRLGTADLNLGM